MNDSKEKNYYELLGVTRDAPKSEIKAAYRDIARVYHPDSNFFDEIIDDGLSTEQSDVFKLLTAAYHTLIDEDSRAQYDQTLPPVLPGWGEIVGNKPDLSALKKKSLRPSATMGNFGVINDQDEQDKPASSKDIKPVFELFKAEDPFNALLNTISEKVDHLIKAVQLYFRKRRGFKS